MNRFVTTYRWEEIMFGEDMPHDTVAVNNEQPFWVTPRMASLQFFLVFTILYEWPPDK